jgi:hypothetical protein
MYLCAMDIDFASLYDFDILFWNCCHIVFFFILFVASKVSCFHFLLFYDFSIGFSDCVGLLFDLRNRNEKTYIYNEKKNDVTTIPK